MSDKPDLRVVLVQTDLVWQDPAANRNHFERLLAGVLAADLVILPEMFATGFSMESERLAEPEEGPTTRWLLAQAAAVGAVITGSLIVRAADGSFRNRLLWARPDGSLAYYDKRHLFRMAGEHQHYTAGDRQLVVQLNGWRIRPLICYDLRFPAWSRDALDTDVLLYTANWPATRREHWNRLLPARAIENLCYVAAVNRIGQDGNGHGYSGDSQVLDFQGNALLRAEAQRGLFPLTLSAKSLQDYRERFPAYQDADAFRFL